MKTSAHTYVVSTDGEHGTFFVRTGKNGLGNVWLQLTVNSTFGTFGNTFGSIGGSAAAFLSRVDYGYLMNKLMGPDSTVFDLDKAASGVRGRIADHRRHGDVDKDEARDMWNVVASAESECSGSHDRFFHMLTENERLYDWEIWDVPCQSKNPQAVGFWEQLWPLFLADLQADAQAIAA